eukprot:468775-Amphidinium_carterae.1
MPTLRCASRGSRQGSRGGEGFSSGRLQGWRLRKVTDPMESDAFVDDVGPCGGSLSGLTATIMGLHL